MDLFGTNGSIWYQWINWMTVDAFGMIDLLNVGGSIWYQCIHWIPVGALDMDRPIEYKVVHSVSMDPFGIN